MVLKGLNMKKINWIFIVILLLGTAFRLINLDKSGGLWYDEAVIYSIASKQGLAGMLAADLHRFIMFPFYYLIYHFWILIFGNGDLIIRLMSVFFDILAMITAYFIGKQFAVTIDKNKNGVGIICMLLYGINSSFIYYAQEAKFYSLTFFIINLIILFWLKFIQQKSKKNLFILLGLNYLLFLTYSAQILFIILLFCVTMVYLLKNKRNKDVLIYLCGILPLIVVSLCLRKYFTGNFDAVVYDNSFIILAIQNWFTPILEGLQNNVLKYQWYLLTVILDIRFWIYILLPAGIMIFALFKALKKYSITSYLFFAACLYVIVHILLTYFTNYSVLVRYTLPVLPIFIFIAAVGFSEMNKWILSIFVSICVFIIISPLGAAYIKRPDGYLTLAVVLDEFEINNQNDFIMPIRTDLLDKYYSVKGKKYSIYTLNSDEAMKTYLSEDEIQGIKNDKNKHKYIKRYINEKEVPKDFEDFIMSNFVNDNDIVLIVDKSIATLSDEQLKTLVKYNTTFETYPFQFIRLSKINNDLIKVLSKNMNIKNHTSDGNWEVYEFSKRK